MRVKIRKSETSIQMTLSFTARVTLQKEGIELLFFYIFFKKFVGFTKSFYFYAAIQQQQQHTSRNENYTRV